MGSQHAVSVDKGHAERLVTSEGNVDRSHAAVERSVGAGLQQVLHSLSVVLVRRHVGTHGERLAEVARRLLHDRLLAQADEVTTEFFLQRRAQQLLHADVETHEALRVP